MLCSSEETIPYLAEVNSATGSDVSSTDSEKTDEMDACLDALLADSDDEEPTAAVPASNDDEFAMPRTDHDPTTLEILPQRGGLVNLGNTCYMASALQMLASVEDFTRTLSDASPLHQSLRDVFDRLRNGETVRPGAFKEIVDQRSCLFAGYHQQDAHEFLTTLLDLLDEDYKQQSSSAEPCNDDDATAATDTMSDVPDSLDVNKSLDEYHCVTSFAESETQEDPEQTEESTSSTSESTMEMQTSPKRPRTDDVETEFLGSSPSTSFEAPSTTTTTKPFLSFSALDVDAIGKLLHGDASSDHFILPEISTTCCGMEPQYKLIGGRMSTADVLLTPYTAETNPKAAEETTGLPAVHEEEEDVASDASSTGEEPAATSPVDDYFTTSVQVRLTCDSCKYTRYHKETFLHLSVEIASDSVEDGLRRFFAPCKQEIKCEKCFYETATQTMTVKKLPMYMLVHFKRFIVDVSPDYSSISYRKDGSEVYYGESLIVDDSVASLQNESCHYKLQSLVHHIGASAASGHYIADSVAAVPGNEEEEENNQWLRFNDSFVQKIASKDAIDESRHTAYMAMYRLESERYAI